MHSLNPFTVTNDLYTYTSTDKKSRVRGGALFKFLHYVPFFSTSSAWDKCFELIVYTMLSCVYESVMATVYSVWFSLLRKWEL